MAIDYAAIGAGALGALTDAGTAMTLRVPSAGAYSPVTGTVSPTWADYGCTGVLLPPDAMNGSGFTFGPDVLVRAEALIYLAAYGLAVRPKPGNALVVGADRWLVIGSDTLAPAGTAVLHALAVVAAPDLEAPGTQAPAILLESGGYLLLESGDRILLEA